MAKVGLIEREHNPPTHIYKSAKDCKIRKIKRIHQPCITIPRELHLILITNSKKSTVENKIPSLFRKGEYFQANEIYLKDLLIKATALDIFRDRIRIEEITEKIKDDDLLNKAQNFYNEVKAFEEVKQLKSLDSTKVDYLDVCKIIKTTKTGSGIKELVHAQKSVGFYNDKEEKDLIEKFDLMPNLPPLEPNSSSNDEKILNLYKKRILTEESENVKNKRMKIVPHQMDSGKSRSPIDDEKENN